MARVTDETKQELEQIEDRLQANIKNFVFEATKEGFKDVKESIKELIGKDIEHVEFRIEKHDQYHEEHREGIKDLEHRVTNIETASNTIDKQETKSQNKQIAVFTIVGVIVAILTFIVGLKL